MPVKYLSWGEAGIQPMVISGGPLILKAPPWEGQQLDPCRVYLHRRI